MGRLGYLATVPESARPGELDRLAEAWLLKGKRPRSDSDWLTERQIRTRQEKEPPLGDHVERVRKVEGDWMGRLPKLRRIKKPQD